MELGLCLLGPIGFSRSPCFVEKENNSGGLHVSSSLNPKPLIPTRLSFSIEVGSSRMAFFRRVLGGSATAIPSQFAAIRHNSTLTSPKLFISGLSRLTTDEKLKESFSEFGKIEDAKVITDRVTGRSKGFAFITYSSIEEAEKAREGRNGKFLDGWVIFVDPAKPREYRPPPQAQPESSDSGFKVNKTIGWCG